MLRIDPEALAPDMDGFFFGKVNPGAAFVTSVALEVHLLGCHALETFTFIILLPFQMR